MFLSNKRPFCQSAVLLQLDAIPQETYLDFVNSHFAAGRKTVSPEAVAAVYDTFEGVTCYIQRIMHDGYTITPEGGTCTLETARALTRRFVQENDSRLRELMAFVSGQQKALLYAICEEGTARHITSAAFVRRHNLRSQSSVQSAVKRLLDLDLITGQERQYRLSDPLLRK